MSDSHGYEQWPPAQVGDLILGFYGDRSGVAAIEEVADDKSADEIVTRWRDQLVGGGGLHVEIWEAKAGFHFTRRDHGG
jgi:hypothetical protein